MGGRRASVHVMQTENPRCGALAEPQAGRCWAGPAALQAWPVISHRMMMIGSGTPSSQRQPERMQISVMCSLQRIPRQRVAADGTQTGWRTFKRWLTLGRDNGEKSMTSTAVVTQD